MDYFDVPEGKGCWLVRTDGVNVARMVVDNWRNVSAGAGVMMRCGWRSATIQAQDVPIQAGIV